VPDREVLELLRELSRVGGVRVELVSGRPRAWLDAWFEAMPIALWAEHGSWYRPQGLEAWQRTAPQPAEWLDTFVPIMERFVVALPGSHLEVKDASVVWHSREALDGPATERTRQLRSLLHETAGAGHVDVLDGRRTVEVRPHWMGKAIVVRHLLQAGVGPAQIVAFGDDPSDEELFQALPRESLIVAVGPHIVRADYRLTDHRDVRDLLRHVIRDPWHA
jgi:trehalose 6-phosphate synthase/phosphatase